jgi:hypothetical protein
LAQVPTLFLALRQIEQFTGVLFNLAEVPEGRKRKSSIISPVAD